MRTVLIALMGVIAAFSVGCSSTTSASAVAMTQSSLVKNAIQAAQEKNRVKNSDEQKRLKNQLAATDPQIAEPGIGVAFFKNKEPDGQDITVAVLYKFDADGKVEMVRSYMTAGSGWFKVFAPAAAIALADVLEEPLVKVPKFNSNNSVRVSNQGSRATGTGTGGSGGNLSSVSNANVEPVNANATVTMP